MTSRRRSLTAALLALALTAGVAADAAAGVASQTVRREMVRRAEVVAVERAAVRAAEQQAARRAALRAAEQRVVGAEAQAARVQAQRQVALREALAKDARRDGATKAVPLSAERRVWRYTGKREAERELKSGVPAGAHMTPSVRPGRPPSAATAQNQYGLPRMPEARLTIRLHRGTPTAHNKALAGRPGRGELTAPVAVPRENIEKVILLH